MKTSPLRGPVAITGTDAGASSGPSVATVAVGKAPGQIAFNPVTGAVLVVNTGSSSVTVIDAQNNTGTIAVQDAPTELVVNPITGNAYVMNSGSNSITAIYKNGYVENIPTWTSEYDAMALNSATNKLYVGHLSQACVTVIDLDTLYIDTIPATYPGFMAIAVNAETNRIYAANMNSDANYVLAIDGNDNSTTTIAVGDYPASVVVNAAANTVYVGNLHGNSTSVIDGSSNSVATTIGGPAVVVALDTANAALYSLTPHPKPPPFFSPVYSLSVIDCASNTVSATAQPGFPMQASAVAIDPAGGKIYTAPGAGNQVLVYDAKSINAQPATITVGNTPIALALDAAGKTLYVSNWADNTVSVVTGI